MVFSSSPYKKVCSFVVGTGWKQLNKAPNENPQHVFIEKLRKLSPNYHQILLNKFSVELVF